MTDDGSLHHQKSGKTKFDHVYNLEDPRGYFSALGEVDYSIAGEGQRFFTTLLEARGEDLSGDQPCVVDICCSYGINAALLKHHVTLDELYGRYGSRELESISSEELAADDARFYGDRRKEHPPRVVGVDVADKAVAYGLKSGVLDAGAAENLEDHEPSEALAREVSCADLLTVTGGVGYISGRTFGRLLACVEGRPAPWVAAFALRWVRYESIAGVLSDYGLVTEKLEGHTFRQRRFADDAERDYVIEEVVGMGLDPDGKEAEGYYHAEFYLSRPREETLESPIQTLMKPALDRV